MSENSANSKRIAKNTLMLYFRMLLMMGATLYTSRVVLEALGVEDYGIYNVVGGVVAMFTIISNSLSNAISRFITFELGTGNQEKLNKIFSTSVVIQLIIGIVIAILVETVGVWFLENKMVIPPDRLVAARWVLQFSLITLIINLISIPYNAAIIAHERMSAFAYISILEALGKLAIAYFITISPIDKLIFYSILMALVALIIRFTYSIYCRRHFEEAKFRWVFDKILFKEMFGFAGWNFIGASAVLLRDQGGNILLNLFGGPSVNAARGIAIQVKNAVTQFSTNFMIAINPQITKSYAANDEKYMMTLILQGSRLSFYMLLTLSLPILLNTEYILSLWLNVTPAYSVSFVQLSLIFGIIEAMSNPLVTVAMATGEIRKYQLVIGLLIMLNIPASYLLLRAHFPPTVVFTVAILIAIACLFCRLFLLRKMIRLSVNKFLNKVICNVIIVTFVAMIIPSILHYYFEVNFLFFILISLISVLSTLSSIYFVGCSRFERALINKAIKKYIKSNKN